MLRPSRLLTTFTAVLLLLGVAAAPAQAQTFNRDVVSTILPSGMGASWVRHSADVTRASYSLNTDTGKLTGLIRVTRLDPRAYTAGYVSVNADITGAGNSLDETIEVQLYRTPTGTLWARYRVAVKAWRPATPGYSVSGNAVGFSFTDPSLRGRYSLKHGETKLEAALDGYGSFEERNII